MGEARALSEAEVLAGLMSGIVSLGKEPEPGTVDAKDVVAVVFQFYDIIGRHKCPS